MIAIGNVRLFEEVQARTRDLTESLEQQTATSEVLAGHLKFFAGELAPVFEAYAEQVPSICAAQSLASFFSDEGDGVSHRRIARYDGRIH